MQSGDILTIEAGPLVAGGEALTRVDGFPVFASGIFPGDVARVRLVEVKKGFARADLVDLVTPSPWRRAMPCPVAGTCGGCDWTALRLDRQLEAKQGILEESLRRIGKLDVATLPPITIHPSPLNYRLRSRLHRDGDAVGFYAMRSRQVVPLPPECEVVGIRTARSPQTAAEEDGDVWELDGEVITGESDLTIAAGPFTYRLHTRAFFQVNRHLLGTMLRLVSDHAERVTNRGTAVDLYGGVGFFTLAIAKHFRQVTMIEGSPLSVRYARVNLPKHVKVIAAPVEEKMGTLPEVDFTFLDPPRAGTRPRVIDAISRQTREIIAYLSCDPVTFSRDASRLIASGWRLASLDLLDLFPNTHHVETLSSFERAP